MTDLPLPPEPVGAAKLAGNILTVGGKSYHLSPLRIAQTLKLAQFVKERLSDKIALAKQAGAGLSEESQTKLLQTAIDDIASGYGWLGTNEANAVLNTREGQVEHLFYRGQKQHPAMTRDDWEDVLDAYTEEITAEIIAKITAEANGGAVADPKAPSGEPPTDT